MRSSSPFFIGQASCGNSGIRRISLGFCWSLGIFAAWAIPSWQAMPGGNLAQTWSIQLTGRFTGDDFKLGNWLLNIPRGLAYFLPWTLLLPLVRGAALPTSRETNLLRALIWGCAVPFLVVNLLPGALPRYSMPVLVPASWLMAMTLTAGEIRPPAWWRGLQIPSAQRRLRLVIYHGRRRPELRSVFTRSRWFQPCNGGRK